MLPAGRTPLAWNRSRTWLPASTTGRGAGGFSAAASAAGRRSSQLGCQAAIRANRCGSTPSMTCPAPAPDALV